MGKTAMIRAARRRADKAALRLHQAELRARMAEVAERVHDSEPVTSARAKRAELRRKRAELRRRRAELTQEARAASQQMALKAQATAAQVASKAQAAGEQAASKAQAAGERLAARSTETAARAQARTEEIARRRLRRVGARLGRGRSAELLGIEPSRRRFPWWGAGLLGISVGFGAARVICARRAADTGLGVERPIAEAVRRELTTDPRTAGLADLTVDVAEGVVFVRGTVPADCDPEALREVIEKVPGVQDVDLQVVGV